MNIRTFSFLAAMLAAAPAVADVVYKSVDPNGNVVYSDKPSPNSEKIEVGELPTVPALVTDRSGPRPPGEDEDADGGQAPLPPDYTRLEITSPANDTALRMEGDNLTVPVTVSLDPPLFGTDTIVLFLDGKEYASGRGPGFQVTNVERGTHELRAIVRGPDGKILESSPTSTFHVLLHSALQPKSTVGTPPKKPK